MVQGDAGGGAGSHFPRGLACLLGGLGLGDSLPSCKGQKPIWANFIRKGIYLKNKSQTGAGGGGGGETHELGLEERREPGNCPASR